MGHELASTKVLKRFLKLIENLLEKDLPSKHSREHV